MSRLFCLYKLHNMTEQKAMQILGISKPIEPGADTATALYFLHAKMQTKELLYEEIGNPSPIDKAISFLGDETKINPAAEKEALEIYKSLLKLQMGVNNWLDEFKNKKA